MNMSPADIEIAVRECILQVAREQLIELPELTSQHRVVDDLGFSSLDVATLTALLEHKFKVDPFQSGMASITEIRTLQDMFNLYNRCLNQTTMKAAVKTNHLEAAEKARLQKRILKKAG